MIQIAIAEDETMFRKGVISLLQDDQEIVVVLEATDGQDLLHQLQHIRTIPHVLLLDLNMPQMNGVDTSKVLRNLYPDLKIIVLSTYFSDAFVLNMIELGASAYLPKNIDPTELRQTILNVLKNGFCYSPQVQMVIHQSIQQKTKPKLSLPFGIELTPRELEILQLICEENTTPEIAKKLFVSPRTVDGYRNTLLEKLDCKNLAGLVVYAMQHQLVKL
ncbi:MAG: response regulator transcription factor [Phycisphaerae bacterium]|nr:response regulator transcription factor [Saprospiraceae bacterium]